MTSSNYTLAEPVCRCAGVPVWVIPSLCMWCLHLYAWGWACFVVYNLLKWFRLRLVALVCVGRPWKLHVFFCEYFKVSQTGFWCGFGVWRCFVLVCFCACFIDLSSMAHSSIVLLREIYSMTGQKRTKTKCDQPRLSVMPRLRPSACVVFKDAL